MLNLGVVHLENKKCNYCGEEIEASATRCPHCGSILEIDVDNYDDVKENENMSKGDSLLEEKVSDFEKSEASETEDIKPLVNNSETHRESTENRENIRRQQYAYNSYKSNYNGLYMQNRNTLSNGLKVFITILCTLIPGLGQLAGIIISIIFMNTQDDVPDYADKRSFGLALLIACIIIFVLACIGCFALAFAASFQRGF